MPGIRKHRWYYLAGVAGIFFLLPLYYAWDPEGGLFPACPFHSLTGLYCTGCGSQRALHDLMHLDLLGSFSHNLLFPPAVVLLGLHFGNRVLRGFDKVVWKSPLDARRAPLVLLAVVLLFTLLRNLPWAPFSHLAP